MIKYGAEKGDYEFFQIERQKRNGQKRKNHDKNSGGLVWCITVLCIVGKRISLHQDWI